MIGVQVIVESRNYTGIMLIDRNDELCILYEKHNIQEKVLQTGDIEMVRLDNEVCTPPCLVCSTNFTPTHGKGTATSIL